MLKLKVNQKKIPQSVDIELPTSKSESNRLLIAQAFANNKFKINKLSTAEDTLLLKAALQSEETVVDVGMAGTAFRFLTAYFALQNGRKTILTGALRMKQRPIKILVDALQKLGASISYLEKEGYPPLEIHGKKLNGGKIEIDGSISSQYISALLLAAPALNTPLELKINRLVSKPYVDLTFQLMKTLNTKIFFIKDTFFVHPSDYKHSSGITVTTDWSSAAFFYQIMVFSKIKGIVLKGLQPDSEQGDKRLVDIFAAFGVETTFDAQGAILRKSNISEKTLNIDLGDCPDLIPSVAVAAALTMEVCEISGVSTLRIKESNRVEALKSELSKINVEVVDDGDDKISIQPKGQLPDSVFINTYNDHRIAMCFSTLVFALDNVEIENQLVVNKSFPNFWEQLASCGVEAIKT